MTRALVVLALVLIGCGPTNSYCQSGPQNGTQCYASPAGSVQGPTVPPQESPPQQMQNNYR